MPGFDWTEIAKYASRARADLSASVTHWTKDRDGLSAFDVLKRILRERRIVASTPEGGYIKAGQRATCFSESPVTVMTRLFRLAEHDRMVRVFLKWKPYGLSFWKPVVYQQYGGRPVLYRSNEEFRRLVTAPASNSRTPGGWFGSTTTTWRRRWTSPTSGSGEPRET